MKIFMIMAIALAASGCGKQIDKTEASALPPVQVRTVVVQQVDWPTVYEAVGTVRAKSSATIASRLTGYIRDMRVNAGDHVRAGQLLAVIDSRDLEAASGQAAAALNEAQSGIAEADNAVGSAKAQLELAETTFRRMEDLYSKRSISDQEFDEAKSRVRVAQAAHQMAVAKRKQLDAKIRQAEQAARGAEVMRGYSEIRAPFAGVVTEKRAEQGDMANPGTPLMTIEMAGVYQFEVPVEEARVGAIRAAQPVSVSLDALAQTVQARVSEVVPAIDAASRTFLVKVNLPVDIRLRSGLFGRARFVLSSRPVIAVPVTSIVAMGQVRSISVVEDGIARVRLVSLGERSGEMVEVLSGVAAAERVVAPRPANLPDGAKVEVRP